MIGIRTARTIPFALVHTHHPPRVTSDAVVRKKVRRVRKYEVYRFRREFFKYLDAIALVNLVGMFGIMEDRR